MFKLNSDCWTRAADVHGSGGTHRNFATLAECLSACVNDSACVAVDWEPDNYYGEKCWILTSTAVGSTLDPGFITHYELDRACLS